MQALKDKQQQWTIKPAEVFAMGPVVPVLVIHKTEHALPVANALLEGGIRTLEITLRTANALAIIEKIARELPAALVGAGTVTNVEQLQQATQAGAGFLISPGLTAPLLDYANEGRIPLIPGITTISELMTGLDHGYSHFKFFPAEASGGTRALQSFAGPFPEVRFCPTGGIRQDNMKQYLELPNVACVGGSWLVTPEILAQEDWAEITRRSRAVLAQQ